MKKRIAVILSAIALCAVCVGVTLAVLSGSSRPVVNTFVAGDISITLSESTGASYRMIPGVEHKKDPYITVKTGSEPCWLFFRAECSAGFDEYMSYEIADGWTQLEGVDGVYFREVSGASADLDFQIIRDNRVLVLDTVTEEKLASLSKDPTLKFYAYAVQSEGVASASAAWQSISQ